MRMLRIARSTVIGIVIGGVAVNAVPALAQMAVIDVSSIAQQIQSVAKETGILDVLNTMSTVQNAINQGINDFNKAIGLNTYGDTNTLLRQGFTQNANYSKAQIGAQQQIVDASNTVMSQFQLGIRQAQIRDEQAPSPTPGSGSAGLRPRRNSRRNARHARRSITGHAVLSRYPAGRSIERGEPHRALLRRHGSGGRALLKWHQRQA